MRFGAHCVLYGPETGTDPRAVISRLAKTGAQGCEIEMRDFSVLTGERNFLPFSRKTIWSWLGCTATA